jgi:PAS domain S-box-containing protein
VTPPERSGPHDATLPEERHTNRTLGPLDLRGSIWGIAGLVYAGAYAALIIALDDPHTRLIVGNAALLLPPLVPLFVLAKRRGDWHGRQAVFFAAIGAWAALWFVGQIGWAADELLRGTRLPWFKWHILLQLSGSALPLIALVAWPHRGARAETASMVALDIAILVSLTGFLYWSLILAPGLEPAQSAMALRALATIGPLVRLSAVVGLLLASVAARENPWAETYRRLAYGMILAFAALVILSFATVRGTYQTGSPTDVGWMLPFWFAAWAAATAPASVAEPSRSVTSGPRHSSPALLFAALLTVAAVGYGLRFLAPLSGPVERLRELATAFTLMSGIALVMIRMRLEQRAVEQANQRVRLLATACEQAGELIVIVSSDSRVEYANDAFCRALGYTRGQLASLPPLALVAPASAGEVPALRQNLIAGTVTRITAMLARRDGTTFQAACVAAPIVDAARRVTHFVAVIRDITDEVRLREQLVRGERLSALGEFVSGVAHEVNNPLQSIIGVLDLVLERELDPSVRGDLERTRFEAGRAGRIVRNLLMFVRPSSTERMLADLNEIVLSTVGVRAYELEMAGVQTREQYAQTLPLVLANRDEIQQVVLNLVINAQQAMSATTGARILSVRTLIEGGDAVVEVRDTGPGMPAELAARIFEPFVTTKAPGTGTGLGLSLSFGIARAHGGVLELVSTDSGCCFRLTLPGAGFPGPTSVH